jgi:hypothetical protein
MSSTTIQVPKLTLRAARTYTFAMLSSMKCIGKFVTVIVSLSATAYAQQHPVWSSVDLLVARGIRPALRLICCSPSRISAREQASKSQFRWLPVLSADNQSLKGEPFENVLGPKAELWAPLQYDPSLPADGREWGHHLNDCQQRGTDTLCDIALQWVDA